MVRPLHTFLLAATLAVLTACAMTPEEAMTLKAESLQQRQLQTRRFDTGDESKILSACASLLQDLGLKIDEASEILGISEATAKRWWAYARAWLYEEIQKGGGERSR